MIQYWAFLTTVPGGHPPSYDSLLDIELAKSLVEQYKRSLERKDTNVRAKGRFPPSAVQSPRPQSSGGASAAAAAAPSTSTPHMKGERHGTVPPHPYTHQAGMFPPPNPHQWAPGGAYGGIQGPPRFPNPYTMHQQPQAMHQQQQQPMHQLPQQPIAHPWLYNQWTMLPNNGYGASHTMGPQHAMDQNWFIPSPTYG